MTKYQCNTAIVARLTSPCALSAERTGQPELVGLNRAFGYEAGVESFTADGENARPPLPALSGPVASAGIQLSSSARIARTVANRCAQLTRSASCMRVSPRWIRTRRSYVIPGGRGLKPVTNASRLGPRSSASRTAFATRCCSWAAMNRGSLRLNPGAGRSGSLDLPNCLGASAIARGSYLNPPGAVAVLT